MPAWIPRLIAMVMLSVLATWAAVWLVTKLRVLLTTLVLALFISFAFEPAVQYLARRGYRRTFATAIVFALAGILGVTFVSITLPPLIVQSASLAAKVPVWLNDLSDLLARRFGITVELTGLMSNLIDVRSALQSYASTVASGVIGLGSAVAGLVVQAMTLALFTFYLLADGPRLRRRLLSVFRPERQDDVVHMWEVAIAKTGGYVYSRSLLGFFSAVFTYVALHVIDVPFALPLALWVGVTSQFLPALGTYLAAIVPTLVALADGPGRAVAVVSSFAAYQVLENYVLAPRITARTMSMHPAVAFGSVLAGISILGIAGAFIALPVAATLQALLSTYVHFHEVAETEASQPTERETSSIVEWLNRRIGRDVAA
jgi:predicted PurR-regulated permease PerM